MIVRRDLLYRLPFFGTETPTKRDFVNFFMSVFLMVITATSRLFWCVAHKMKHFGAPTPLHLGGRMRRWRNSEVGNVHGRARTQTHGTHAGWDPPVQGTRGRHESRTRVELGISLNTFFSGGLMLRLLLWGLSPVSSECRTDVDSRVELECKRLKLAEVPHTEPPPISRTLSYQAAYQLLYYWGLSPWRSTKGKCQEKPGKIWRKNSETRKPLF